VWRFPIVGKLPYIGFFDRRQGLEVKQQLEQEGYDTEYRPVPAFSSLGWLADPVYSPMLDGDISRLIEVVIHETTHTTIFLRNQVAFNESLAVFVGNQGTLDFLASIHGASSPEVERYRQSINRRRIFSKLVSETYNQLDKLYRSEAPREEKLIRREAIFRSAQERYKQLFPDPRYWNSFVRRPLNNAIFLNYGRYNQGIEFHYRVYQSLGQSLYRLVELYKRAQKFPDPIAYVARGCGMQKFIKQRM